MNAVGRQAIGTPRILSIKVVTGRNLGNAGFDGGDNSGILGDARKIGLMIDNWTNFCWQPLDGVKGLPLRIGPSSLYFSAGGKHGGILRFEQSTVTLLDEEPH